LAGEPGARREAALLNAAAGIAAGGKADALEQGYALAKAALDGGQAAAKLQALIEHCR
jgi:anthranilate phosphoribosyltransferase